MKIEQLRSFVETAKKKQLAADALENISALEAELGNPLFDTNGSQVALTDHGLLLLDRALEILMHSSQKAAGKNALSGHYRIAAAHLLCSKILTPAWSALQAKSPQLTAEIYTLRSGDVASAVAAGKLDFGLCFNAQERPELECKPLMTGKLVVVFRKGHKMWKMKKPFPQALLQNGAVLPKAFQALEICEDHPVFLSLGIQPRTECLVDSYEVAVEKVACSDCWSLVPDWAAADPRLKKLKAPMEWDATYQISAVWPKGNKPPAPLAALTKALTAYLPKKKV